MDSLTFSLSNYVISPLFILLQVGGLIGVITFFFLLKFRSTPGVKFMLVWQLASSIWAFTYAFEFAAIDLATKIFWSKLSYLGIVNGPVSFMFFSLAFSSKNKFLKAKYIWLVYGVATLFILSPFTNDLHHLHWRSYSINPAINSMNYVYGPLFWLMTLFAYFALFTGIVNVFLLYFRLSPYYRRQITLLFVASLLPPLGNLIYVFKINPIPGFDWTPFTFLFTGILIAIDLAQYKMFDLVPFGRNTLIDILPDGILIFDNSLRIADSNPTMLRFLGADKSKIIGKSVNEIFPRRKELIDQIIDHEDFQTKIETDVDGEPRFYDVHSNKLFDQNKQLTGHLVILKDITRHVLSEEKTKEINIRLTSEIEEKEKLISDLDAFSHTVAHDLKNMLGSIVNASDLIQTNFDDLSRAEMLDIIQLIGQSATKTMHITRELLTLASVRQQEIKPVAVNMIPVLEESLGRLKDFIKERNASITMNQSCPEVWGFHSWLEEVWVNYISNALKYGGNPPVIQIGNDILPGGKVRFWITDNGNGLSEDEMAKLFNKFTRLDTLRAEGHGLGLSIVKRIIEKLGGEVGVESNNKEGDGCVFYFVLPLTKS